MGFFDVSWQQQGLLPELLHHSEASGCRMDPLWNSVVVAGLQDDKPFLGTISMLGVHFSDVHIATGECPDITPLWRSCCMCCGKSFCARIVSAVVALLLQLLGNTFKPESVSIMCGSSQKQYLILSKDVLPMVHRVWAAAGQAAVQGEAQPRHERGGCHQALA